MYGVWKRALHKYLVYFVNHENLTLVSYELIGNVLVNGLKSVVVVVDLVVVVVVEADNYSKFSLYYFLRNIKLFLPVVGGQNDFTVFIMQTIST